MKHTLKNVFTSPRFLVGFIIFMAILLTVLIENGEPYALIMDEPEVSLHIEWQQCLIALIRKLNPRAQVILSTHSPALIMDGWTDKVTEVDDITY